MRSGIWLLHLPENTDPGHCSCFNAYTDPGWSSRLNEKQIPFPCVTPNYKHYSKQFTALNLGVSAFLRHFSALRLFTEVRDMARPRVWNSSQRLGTSGSSWCTPGGPDSWNGIRCLLLKYWSTFCHDQKFTTCVTAQLMAVLLNLAL